MTAPARIPPSWSTVLGLSEPAGVDWGQVRAVQVNTLRRLAPGRLLVSVVGVATIVHALWQRAPFVMIAAWAGVLLLASGWGAYRKLRVRRWQVQSATMTELHGETAVSILIGCGWGALPVLFAPYAGPVELLVIWAACIVMMSGAAFGLSVLPLATAIYLLVVGGGLGWSMYALGQLEPVVIAAAYTVGMLACTLFAGRKTVMAEAAQQALAEKTEVVSLLLREFDDSGGDWMWQTDAAKCLTHVSPRFAVALGVEPAELETKPLLEILGGDAWTTGNLPPALHQLAEKLKRRESFSQLVLPLKVAGETHWWELSASPRFDDAGAFLGFRGVGSDVTAERRTADKINHMARFDTLTGLPNRLNVTEALSEALELAEHWRSRCAFLMIDLDRFKAVNDTLGHPVGDRLLMRVAERLKGLMRDGETCGRLGGDEFAVVVKDGGETKRVAELARAVIETLSQPYEVDQHTLYIGASVGTAFGPRDGRTVETLIRSADLALYRSKDDGGGSAHVYEPQLHSHAEERRVLEIELRRALERRQFTVCYQPVVSAQSGQVESFEALLRWTHPELGPVSPMKFIPIAEDTRLIGPIGEWVLMTACMEARNWPETVKVAVNVSAEQLVNPSFVTTVMQALSRSGLPAHRLELEVTESCFLREGKGVVGVLDQLLGLGIRLALDDFGTGYSSLGYLSRTKFSTIKIDRSFVTAAAKNVPEALAIIRAVVALADSLGMSTTAEGIETDRELALLRDLGCRKIQGYLFGRPMAAKDALKLFSEARAVA